MTQPGRSRLSDERWGSEEAGASTIAADDEVCRDHFVEQWRDRPGQWRDGTGDEHGVMTCRAMVAHSAGCRRGQATENDVGDVLVDDAHQLLVVRTLVTPVDRSQKGAAVAAFGEQP